MEQGLGAGQKIGAFTPSGFLAWLAKAKGDQGQIEDGLAILEEALNRIDETGERRVEAELYRSQGELLLAKSANNRVDAATCFHKVLNVARLQQAKFWELRAATSLAHAWRSQNKNQESYDLLAPVYDRFTEGFETVDLQEVKLLLDQLR